MTLQIAALPFLCTTPDLNQKIKCNVARKSGHKYVSGNTFKKRTTLNKLKDFIGASRGVSVVSKAHFESKQYLQAALVRKNEAARRIGHPLTDAEYDKLVWDSDAVQNRANREDHVRYNPVYFDKAKGASNRNVLAHRISRKAHWVHGVCEMMAAPTGMTNTLARNAVTQCTEEKSTKNKAFMFGLLAFIGVGTGMAVSEPKKLINASSLPEILGQSLLGALIAFPAISSFTGFIGSVLGLTSQAIVEKQHMGTGQKTDIQKDLNTNMNQLLHYLKSVHGKPELVQVTARAMQGIHFFGKVGAAHLDHDKVPMILKQALAAIDLTKSNEDNILALTRALGSYLQVDKPANDSTWARYRYAKAVTEKESHFVALLSLIDHSETKTTPKQLVDARRALENTIVPSMHRKSLRFIGHALEPVDMMLKTSMSGTLKKWGTKGYAEIHSAKMSDPKRAAKNCFKGEYMANNIHQYHGLTRKLILFAEGCRLFNMNVVLASNANLSRIFNNLALNTHRTLGTGPASRSMCHSIGRFLGGAVLAIIFGTVIPSFANVETLDVGTDAPVKFSVANVGILMFILSVPTLMLMGAAQGAAYIQGWKGNVAKQLPPNTKFYEAV